MERGIRRSTIPWLASGIRTLVREDRCPKILGICFLQRFKFHRRSTTAFGETLARMNSIEYRSNGRSNRSQPYIPNKIDQILLLKSHFTCGMRQHLPMMHIQCYLGRGRHCSEAGVFEEVDTVAGKCLTFLGYNFGLTGSYHGFYYRLGALLISSLWLFFQVFRSLDVNELVCNIEVPRTEPDNKSTEDWSFTVQAQQDKPIVTSFSSGRGIRKSQHKYIAVALRRVGYHPDVNL